MSLMSEVQQKAGHSGIAPNLGGLTSMSQRCSGGSRHCWLDQGRGLCLEIIWFFAQVSKEPVQIVLKKSHL